MVTWLPAYFGDELHYSQREVALFGSIPFFVVAGSTLLFGTLSDRWISRGASPNLVRKTCTGAGLLLSTVMLAAATFRDPVISLVLLSVACFAYGIYSSNLWAVTPAAGRACRTSWAIFPESLRPSLQAGSSSARGSFIGLLW
jgi:sugar phosphate permease